MRGFHPEENISLVVSHGSLVPRPEFQAVSLQGYGFVAVVKMASDFLKLHKLQTFTDQDVEYLEVHDVRGVKIGDVANFYGDWKSVCWSK